MATDAKMASRSDAVRPLKLQGDVDGALVRFYSAA